MNIITRLLANYVTNSIMLLREQVAIKLSWKLYLILHSLQFASRSLQLLLSCVTKCFEE